MGDSNSPGGAAARLHSRRQPQLEADRYIEALKLCPGIDYYILIEPGLGYLISSLRTFSPNSKVVVLHASNDFRETRNRYVGVPMWFPGSVGVQEFLEETIPDAASVRVIEWRPSLRVYGDLCLDLVRESTEFIRRLEAGRRTSAVFGGKWVRNFFRNLKLVNQTLLYRTMDMPIVITGSGPSLESAIPKIRAAREGVFVLAASSSLPALMAGDILPDMVITTDGGAWALLHLHTCFRIGIGDQGSENLSRARRAKVPLLIRDCCSLSKSSSNLFGLLTNIPDPRSPIPDPPIAFSLSAALPSQCADVPLLPLNDGSLWQSMALYAIGLPSVLIPQRGTVTASALELALTLTTGNIFLAGMDLAVQDIRSHARPYGFDHLFFGAASRLKPLYSQYFFRSTEMKAGGSHDVYAAWFKNRIASWPQRVFSLGGNHAAFENNLPSPPLTGTMPLTAQKNAALDHFKLVMTNRSPQDRYSHAAETLIAALDNPQYAAALTAELAPLLFPSRSGVQPAEITSALRSIINDG